MKESATHPEATCEECGRANVTWFAPSDIWNAAARRSDGTDPMLCPVCFIKRAEAAGFSRDAWRCAPEFHVWRGEAATPTPLIDTTPTGQLKKRVRQLERELAAAQGRVIALAMQVMVFEKSNAELREALEAIKTEATNGWNDTSRMRIALTAKNILKAQQPTPRE